MNPIYDENLRKTFEKTAEMLSGKTVILRFSEPLAHGANGECYRDLKGITRINISPRLGIQQAYNVALHEIAHAKLDNPQPLTDGQYALTANMDARKVNSDPENKSAHSAADELAARWLELAHASIKHLIRWNTTETQRAIMNMTALQTLSKLKEL